MPIMTHIHHHIVGRHWVNLHSNGRFTGAKFDMGVEIEEGKFCRYGMSRTGYRLRLRDEGAGRSPAGTLGLYVSIRRKSWMTLNRKETSKGEMDMKYILLMSSTKAGVSGYHTWSQSDRDTHMQTLCAIVKELVDTGEFVATQGLAEAREAKVVRGDKNGLPVTDGIFPESKEFLLGYWIVDVATPERAYAIAGRISLAPGPGGVPTNMPIEVRQFADHPESAN